MITIGSIDIKGSYVAFYPDSSSTQSSNGNYTIPVNGLYRVSCRGGSGGSYNQSVESIVRYKAGDDLLYRRSNHFPFPETRGLKPNGIIHSTYMVFKKGDHLTFTMGGNGSDMTFETTTLGSPTVKTPGSAGLPGGSNSGSRHDVKYGSMIIDRRSYTILSDTPLFSINGSSGGKTSVSSSDHSTYHMEAIGGKMGFQNSFDRAWAYDHSEKGTISPADVVYKYKTYKSEFSPTLPKAMIDQIPDRAFVSLELVEMDFSIYLGTVQIEQLFYGTVPIEELKIGS